MMLRIVQGAEIMSQTSRVEAEDEADSDDDKSLPEDSASDIDTVSYPVTVTFKLYLFLAHVASLARCTLLTYNNGGPIEVPCVVESDGSKELCVRWGSRFPREGALWGRMTLGFSRMPLSTILSGPDVRISPHAVRPRKQLSVTLNFPNEKFHLHRGLSSEIFTHLLELTDDYCSGAFCVWKICMETRHSWELSALSCTQPTVAKRQRTLFHFKKSNS